MKEANMGKKFTDAEKIFFIVKRLCADARFTEAFAEGNGLRYHYNRKGEISRIMARNRAGDWESLTCDFVKGEF
jgi:hypothetical protein